VEGQVTEEKEHEKKCYCFCEGFNRGKRGDVEETTLGCGMEGVSCKQGEPHQKQIKLATIDRGDKSAEE